MSLAVADLSSFMANRQLLVVTHTVPPHICGMSDYCIRVAAGLAGHYDRVELGVANLPERPAMEGFPFAVRHWKDAFHEILSGGKSWDVLLNYTPAIYAKSGYPAALLSALDRFKSTRPENRLHVHFHEMWHGGRLRLHHAVRDWLTRRASVRIAALGDGLGVCTEEQKRKLERECGVRGVRLIPVGANILPPAPETGLESRREAGDWVVFGLAHTRLWALQSHLDLLRNLQKQGKVRRLIAVGPKDDVNADQEAALAAEHLGSDFLVQRGPLPPEEISRIFLSCAAALSGQNSDSLRKSGSFSALAAHAVPVICAAPTALRDPPGELLFRPRELLEDPDLLESGEAERRRRLLHAWFWANRSWEAISLQVRVWMEERSENH